MVDHSVRDHATWSASATARNWHCPGALALTANAPPSKESVHSARGTACHAIAEACLSQRVKPEHWLGRIEKTKSHDIEIDDELVASAEMYVDYVRQQADGAKLLVEQRFDLATLGGPFDAGGTADAVIYKAAVRELEVVDLKNGRGFVDVKGNPQLRTYALGAFLANPGLAVDRVTVTIVQPNLPHRDGRIRSETFHVGDLIEWTTDLLAAMHRSHSALVAFERGNFMRAGKAHPSDEWVEAWLRPRKCKFCPAEGWCPALRKSAADVAGLWFDDMDQPKINAPADQSPEAVARDLAALDMLEDWIAARRGFAHALAEAGTEIPGYKLVEKHGVRKWGAAEGKVVADLKAVAGLDVDDVYDRKLKSPAAIDKILGKAGAAKITSMWSKPVTGTSLVRVEATDKPAAAGTAARYFEEN